MAKITQFLASLGRKICTNLGAIFGVKLANFTADFGNFCGIFAEIIRHIFAKILALFCNRKAFKATKFYKSKHFKMYFIIKNTLDLLGRWVYNAPIPKK